MIVARASEGRPPPSPASQPGGNWGRWYFGRVGGNISVAVQAREGSCAFPNSCWGRRRPTLGIKRMADATAYARPVMRGKP
jgi:hypothetical protein